MEIFHFLPTRQVNSQAYDIAANTPICVICIYNHFQLLISNIMDCRGEAQTVVMKRHVKTPREGYVSRNLNTQGRYRGAYQLHQICDKISLRKVWRYQRGNQKPYIDEAQTLQWPKENRTNNNPQNNTEKIKDWATWYPK